ncbi:winged helix-turn-helix transcriptional regulator [Patescibacteria group bacterium]|nr:winged helix-turn-helix transcriptional regulator [Patescibacteria group bacterium]
MKKVVHKKTLKSKKKVQHVDVSGDFRIEQLFGSKTRVRLLGLLLDNPGRSFYVRELTRRIDAQLNSVRRELQNLVKLGIILEVEGKILPGESDYAPKRGKEKKKFYRANDAFPFFDELRVIMKKSAILMNRSFVRELQGNGKIDLLFLTGRFIDNDEVPSDVLIIGKIDAKKLEKAIANFEKEISREINYTYMPKDEFLYRRDVKDRFLMSLINSDKVALINELSLDI